jgi:hypothetical protein
MILTSEDILPESDDEFDEAVLLLVNILEPELQHPTTERTSPAPKGNVGPHWHFGIFPFDEVLSTSDAEVFLFLHMCINPGCTASTCRSCSMVLRILFLQQLFQVVAIGPADFE